MYIRLLTIFALFTAVLVSSLALTACSSNDDSEKAESGADVKNDYPVDPEDARRAKRGKITGDGIRLFGGGKDNNGGGTGVGVNAYLWRATLDTLSFMPLAQVDPHGGVIITDWYEDPEAKGSQFKVNVLILGTELRADGVRVSVFKRRGGKDTPVDKAMSRKMEDAILTRARELKIADSHS